MQALQNYLDRMGNNFLTASLIPSLGFVTLAMFVFQPIMPQAFINRINGTFNPLIESGLIGLLLTIIIGFTLTSLNTFVFKLFEGYVLLWHCKFLTKKEQKQAKQLRRKRELIQRKIDRFSGENQIRLMELLEQAEYMDTLYQSSFPLSDDDIMPTRFGNIMKAAEAYSRYRYNIDGVPTWTRLINVIPDRYMAFMDQKNNQLSFLLNCSILSAFFSFLSLSAAIYQFMLAQIAINGYPSPFYFVQINLGFNVYIQRTVIYMLAVMLSLFMGFLFHKASLFIVQEYGDMIRSSYDLFRFDLLAQFRRTPPKTLKEERFMWKHICSFMNTGNASESFKKMKYYQQAKVDGRASTD